MNKFMTLMVELGAKNTMFKHPKTQLNKRLIT